jgi:hypothetical protein
MPPCFRPMSKASFPSCPTTSRLLTPSWDPVAECPAACSETFASETWRLLSGVDGADTEEGERSTSQAPGEAMNRKESAVRSKCGKPTCPLRMNALCGLILAPLSKHRALQRARLFGSSVQVCDRCHNRARPKLVVSEVLRVETTLPDCNLPNVASR